MAAGGAKRIGTEEAAWPFARPWENGGGGQGKPGQTPGYADD